MKLSCEKFMLQQAAQTAQRTAAAKSAIPALEGLLLQCSGDKLWISGYDLKTGIRTEVNADVVEQGAVVLNARLFCDIIRKMPDEIVMIDVDDHLNASITCGLSRFSIVGFAAADYPELPSIEKQNAMFIEQKKLSDMIAQTSFAISDNEARPVHTGALCEVEDGYMNMVAVDGFRLALRREKLTDSTLPHTSFVVPGTALNEVQRICEDTDKPAEINLGSRFVQFTIGTTELISRRLEGQFLNYRNVLPKTFKYEVEADVRGMSRAFERVSLIISEKNKSPVRCVFGDGILSVSSATALGKAQDESIIKGSGGDLEIGFNNKYMLDMLRAVPAESIMCKLSTNISPAIFAPVGDDESFLYMVLPIRMKSSEN